MSLPIRGVIAAVLFPRDASDRPDWDAFDRMAEFLARSGVAGLCVNGATGEYAGATADERREAIVRARRIAGGERIVISGVGAARWTETVRFADDAYRSGADAVLVPVPHFFKYEQEDVSEFYRCIADRAPIPVLIYNLPAFTGSLEPEAAAELIRSIGGISGVKDSSGRLDLLALLSCEGSSAPVRLVGNDSVLAEALETGVCDGAISGIAGVLPEFTLALWQVAARGDCGQLRELAAGYAELIRRLDAFPVPWGLKFIAEERGWAPANLAIPLSDHRRSQAREFRRWFRQWWDSVEPELPRSVVAGSQRGIDGAGAPLPTND